MNARDVGAIAVPITRLECDFAAWVATEDGQTVKALVAARALTLLERGWKSYGIKAIIESIRYDRNVNLLGDDGYRVNDKYTSFLARRIMLDFPSLREFFPTRELRNR